MNYEPKTGLLAAAGHHLLVFGGSSCLTLGVFTLIPLIQSITGEKPDSMLSSEVSTFEEPDLEEPETEEPEPEPEEEEQPPELETQPEPMIDLDSMESLLTGDLGGGFGPGEFKVDLSSLVGKGPGGLAGLDDLDSKPRALSQPSPVMSAKVRAAAPGSAKIKFVVDERGRVSQAKVARSSNPVFEGPALQAVRKWRFEPATRQGKPVKFPYSVTVTFPKS